MTTARSTTRSTTRPTARSTTRSTALPAAPSAAPSAAQRRYLMATAPVAGAAIMIIEILGAKMLAPYIGTSHFVWTAQIAVAMVALAAGYALGGRLADRSKNPVTLLYIAILLAALALVASTLLCERVALLCLRLDLRAGSLLASTTLFFAPLCLLATAPPILIRKLTANLDNIGRSVGRLTSISTIGSVAGTLAIGYLLIPCFANSHIMLATALVLALTALVHLLVWRPAKLAAPVLLALACAAGCFFALRQNTLMPAIPGMAEIHRSNSNFGLIQVVDDSRGGVRYYLNDFLIQNTYYPRAKVSTSLFTHMLHGLARACTPEIREVLCIGMGVGIVPMQFAGEGAQVDVVEINPAIVPVAQKYFDFDPLKMRTLAIGDGRPWLAFGKNTYDTIILDAFLGEASPSHLMTREAFAAMKARLKPGGTLVINAFGTIRGGSAFFSASLEKTLAAVFATVRLHAVGDGNSYYVATDRAGPAFVHPPNLQIIPLPLREDARAHFASVISVVNTPSAIVLTDNFNPVDYHDARNRELVRRKLALSILTAKIE